MKVGLTYDLRDDYLAEGFKEEDVAEFDSRVTIDGLHDALAAHGFTPVHIGNVRSLVPRLAAGERWDLVFNIAEGLFGFGRESQVPALLDAYEIPYTFSDPAVLGVCLHKAMTKQVLQASGVPTPFFHLIENRTDIANVHLNFPLFAKPVAEGTGKGISRQSRITSRAELEQVCTHLLETFHEPVLVESYLPGREFTVGILGRGQDARALGVIEIAFLRKEENDIYSFHAKENYKELVHYTLCSDSDGRAAADAALAAWRALGCRDAGRIDVRLDDRGVANIIEINPLAGLNPLHSDLPILCRLNGIDYTTLVGCIAEEACRRQGLRLPTKIADNLAGARASAHRALDTAWSQMAPGKPIETVLSVAS